MKRDSNGLFPGLPKQVLLLLSYVNIGMNQFLGFLVMKTRFFVKLNLHRMKQDSNRPFSNLFSTKSSLPLPTGSKESDFNVSQHFRLLVSQM